MDSFFIEGLTTDNVLANNIIAKSSHNNIGSTKEVSVEK